MKFARISVRPNCQGVILGRDMGGIFRPGFVYEIRKISDEYIVTEIGEYALEKKYEVGVSHNVVLKIGSHLVTKREAKT